MSEHPKNFEDLLLTFDTLVNDYETPHMGVVRTVYSKETLSNLTTAQRAIFNAAFASVLGINVDSLTPGTTPPQINWQTDYYWATRSGNTNLFNYIQTLATRRR